MLITIFIIFIGCAILSWLVFLHSKYEYQQYIKKLANIYSTGELNDKIKNLEDYLNNTSDIDSEQLEITIDNIGIYEQVKAYKKEHNLN